MIYYIYKEHGYKSLLLFNEKSISENVSLLVVKMKNGTIKVVNMKFPYLNYFIIILNYIIFLSIF